MGEVTYSSKRWLERPYPSVGELIRRLGYTPLGQLDSDDFIIRRRGETRPIFHMLHISWGDENAVAKYKLFRIDPLGVEKFGEVPPDLETSLIEERRTRPKSAPAGYGRLRQDIRRRGGV